MITKTCKHETTIEVEGSEWDVIVDYNITPGSPATRFDPAEETECEILAVILCGDMEIDIMHMLEDDQIEELKTDVIVNHEASL